MSQKLKLIILKSLLVATVVTAMGSAGFMRAASQAQECSQSTDVSARPDLSRGDRGSCVSVVQQLLDAHGFFGYGSYTSYFGSVTQAGVMQMQRQAGLTQTGTVDQATWQVLAANAGSTNTSGLPASCLTKSKVLCVIKDSGSVARLYVVNAGQIVRTFAARTGDARGPAYATTEGIYSVYWKDKDHLSSEYNNAPMPFSLFFNGGEAIHYSGDFDRNAYGGARSSAGCVNLGDYAGSEWLFNWTPNGTRVVVAHS